MAIRHLAVHGFLWVSLLSSCSGIASGQTSTSYIYMNKFPESSDDCALKLHRDFSTLSPYPFVPYSYFSGPAKTTLNECIKYSDVNEALAKAKKKLRYTHPFERPSEVVVRHIDKSANLILETTKILADRFQLSFEEINEILPTLDTSRTDIWEVCPSLFKPTPCTVSRFRSIDGKCNNVQHDVWGTSNTPFVRFLPPVYSNGIDAPRVSCLDGGPLPNVRQISESIHQDFNRPSDHRSVLLMSWGQFIDHDLTLAAPVRDENEMEVTCCDKPVEFMDPNCMPIDIPADDPFYSKFGVRCLDFLRTLAGHRPGCALGPRVHINLLTSPIDANFIYGSTEKLAKKLRTGSKGEVTIPINVNRTFTHVVHFWISGLMKTWDKFGHLGLKQLLPPMTDNPEQDCIGRPRNLFCFIAGDERVNEQIHLTVLHTVYIRDHNRIAQELSLLNPHWNDERLYQETRHITAASVQYIAYNEFLPMILGPKYLKKYNLTLQKEGYWYGYDAHSHMGPSNAFQTAAFRFGHTHIQGRVRMYDKDHEFLDSMDLHQLLRQPFIIYDPGMMDKLIGGLLNTPAQIYDPFITSEVTNHLFQKPREHFGMDLVSLNLMRAREHGVPGYNEYREWCGMPRVHSFEELEFYMSNGTAFKYSQLYKHPDDIDLWSAGVSERIMEGAMIGPTFACIIAHQFSKLRKGDRFWHENPGFPSSFTSAQLREIRKVTQAKIICENADDIPTIQKWVMKLPDPIHNPRVRCTDLPSMNLEFWIEDPVYGGFLYS